MFFVFAKNSSAATINAASCSRTDVQAAINAASDGDTVFVPAGNCTWTSAISMPSNKNIIIKGAGIDATNISASNNPLFLIANAQGKSWEITGFTLSGPAGPNFPNAYVISTYSWGSHCSSFRIHDNKFKDCQTFRDGGCIQFRGACYGVIYKNQFIGTGSAKMAIDVMDDDYSGETDWTAGVLDLGGPKAVYIEENYFEIAHNARYLSDGQWANWTAIDTNCSGRYVARYNVFKNQYIGGHSSCNNICPGSLKQEVYNNWVWMETGYTDCGGTCGLYQGSALGAGTGIYANNVFEGYIQNSAWMAFWNDRSAAGAGCQSQWSSVCDGTAAMDQNQTPTGTYEGYACRTQPGLGAGTFPTFMPIYIWGNHGCFNTVTTPTVDCKTNPKTCYEQAYANCTTNVTDITKRGARFSSKHFLQNRDYYLSSSPTWSPYTYPHPLTLASGGDTTPPTVSMTSPTSGSTVSGSITISATASDNIGIAGVQFKLDGANLGSEDTTSPYSISWNTATVLNGSHAITATARDTSNNQTTSSGITVTVSNAPDTQAPTVPINLTATAISSSQINLSWTASTDNVGVTGYRIYRCQGAGCTPSTQINTSATNSYSDTGLSSSTTYVYRVAAYDLAGNVSAQSSSASATTQSAPSGSLVAAYSFNEGSGTIAPDSSGNNNNGTLINGPTWTAGKYGNAISFDGTNDYVLLSSSVFGVGAGTITAWIYLKSYGTGGYGYIFDNAATRLMLVGWDAKLAFSSNASTVGVSASNSILLNQWVFVAVTRSDSGTANFYVNGALNGTANQNSGTPGAGFSSPRIGNYYFGGNNYDGTIDELRIYNRALTQSEIQTDMNTPIGAADTTPPAAPSGVTVI